MTTFDVLLERVSTRLGDAAASEGLVDVAVRTVESPVGELLLAATDVGLVRVGFDLEDHELVLAQLAAAIGTRVVEQPAHPVLVTAAAELQEYFTDQRTQFDVPLDLRLTKGPFRREVLGLLQRIPAGETRTYAQLAVEAGRANAVRAVGSGCATNPVPVIVPCHRVLRTGGNLGGYLGGVARKRWLLEHERAIAG